MMNNIRRKSAIENIKYFSLGVPVLSTIALIAGCVDAVFADQLNAWASVVINTIGGLPCAWLALGFGWVIKTRASSWCSEYFDGAFWVAVLAVITAVTVYFGYGFFAKAVVTLAHIIVGV